MELGFFQQLYADDEFCCALGRMTLAAGRFESDLRAYLGMNGVEIPENTATLGKLISALRKHELLSDNGVMVLSALKKQRNYLTHSLFDLFAARTGETLFLRSTLVPGDVALFVETAWMLEQNLKTLSEIAEKRIQAAAAGGDHEPDEDARLFRP